jgi:hypothetical protein
MNIYEQQPPIAATTKTLKEYVTYFCLEARELTQEEREANEIQDTVVDEQGNETPREAWTAHTVVYRHEHPLTEEDYGKMVAAIVRSKYTADDVEAILSNYAAEHNREHETEFNTFQEWRVVAKTAAREALQ